ncbi:hypothetical protein DYB25_001738 [Aphanomyces astaci]|uniref:Uncharacterized protein n=1 Tax=Aphanomyces astaci TaxID=112090 RepID=A0A397BBI0_APHAT|nr:hypothetical protein DYB25_001738 [Aphanomyces astaci]RHY43645.1 hypothetical protein DYB30_004203 [Aphanomyces astaci]
MHMILFTTLSVALECVGLPKTDPLWHRLDPALDPIFASIAAKPNSSNSSPSTAPWRGLLDDSHDVTAVRDIQTFLSSAVSATQTPLQTQLYSLGHWAALFTGVCLCLASIFLGTLGTAALNVVLGVGTSMIVYCVHTLHSSWNQSRRWQSLLRVALRRCELPYAGPEWCHLPPKPKPAPSSAIQPPTSGPSRRLATIDEYADDDPVERKLKDLSSLPPVDASLLASLNPSEMLDALQRLQALLATADVSPETRAKVERGLQVLEHIQRQTPESPLD